LLNNKKFNHQKSGGIFVFPSNKISFLKNQLELFKEGLCLFIQQFDSPFACLFV
ncbi:hypothetical protein M086_1692, partial [Bacteroides fragilis str. S13 L11]